MSLYKWNGVIDKISVNQPNVSRRSVVDEKSVNELLLYHHVSSKKWECQLARDLGFMGADCNEDYWATLNAIHDHDK